MTNSAGTQPTPGMFPMPMLSSTGNQLIRPPTSSPSFTSQGLPPPGFDPSRPPPSMPGVPSLRPRPDGFEQGENEAPSPSMPATQESKPISIVLGEWAKKIQLQQTDKSGPKLDTIRFPGTSDERMEMEGGPDSVDERRNSSGSRDPDDPFNSRMGDKDERFVGRPLVSHPNTTLRPGQIRMSTVMGQLGSRPDNPLDHPLGMLPGLVRPTLSAVDGPGHPEGPGRILLPGSGVPSLLDNRMEGPDGLPPAILSSRGPGMLMGPRGPIPGSITSPAGIRLAGPLGSQVRLPVSQVPDLGVDHLPDDRLSKILPHMACFE